MFIHVLVVVKFYDTSTQNIVTVHTKYTLKLEIVSEMAFTFNILKPEESMLSI